MACNASVSTPEVACCALGVGVADKASVPPPECLASRHLAWLVASGVGVETVVSTRSCDRLTRLEDRPLVPGVGVDWAAGCNTPMTVRFVCLLVL